MYDKKTIKIISEKKFVEGLNLPISEQTIWEVWKEAHKKLAS